MEPYVTMWHLFYRPVSQGIPLSRLEALRSRWLQWGCATRALASCVSHGKGCRAACGGASGEAICLTMLLGADKLGAVHQGGVWAIQCCCDLSWFAGLVDSTTLTCPPGFVTWKGLGWAQVLPMNTGVEGGETAIKLARWDAVRGRGASAASRVICLDAPDVGPGFSLIPAFIRGEEGLTSAIAFEALLGCSLPSGLTPAFKWRAMGSLCLCRGATLAGDGGTM